MTEKEKLFEISPLVEPDTVKNMVGTKDNLPQVQPEKPTPTQIINDFNEARRNVLEVMRTSRTAIDEISDIAPQVQHGTDWYDSLNGALKVMLEANRDLIDMHVKIQKLTENIGGAITKVQNNLFVGSTTELQKLLINMNKEPNGE